MPGTTSTALPSFSHDQHHKTDAAKRKGGVAEMKMIVSEMFAKTIIFTSSRNGSIHQFKTLVKR